VIVFVVAITALFGADLVGWVQHDRVPVDVAQTIGAGISAGFNQGRMDAVAL
jgi:hypothetical protein